MAEARRFAATVSYDGTAFAGSQRQPNARTVQQELERAARSLFGADVRMDLAGRTDAGVHAVGQVAAFTVATRLDAATVGKALNAYLPEDVAVRDVRQVPGAFDPRRDARRRWYRYTIENAPVRMPLLRRTAWHVEGVLDVTAMQRAADALPGRHDFRACSGPLEPGRSSVRTVARASWARDGRLLTFDIEADAFLPKMVRRIVGALVRVGQGRDTVDSFVERLQAARAGGIGPTAPARGLCLQRVWYDEGYVV